MIKDERDLRSILHNESILGVEVNNMGDFCRHFRFPTEYRSPKEYISACYGRRTYKGNTPNGTILVKYTGGKKRMFGYKEEVIPVCDVFNGMLAGKGLLERM